jgi:hypothetical protein
MTIDCFDAAKRALEDADRDRSLAATARPILNRLYPHWAEDPAHAVDRLIEAGFSLPDACRTLEFIDWEDAYAS